MAPPRLVCILVVLALSISSYCVAQKALEGSIIRAMAKDRMNPHDAFYHVFDIATGRVIGTGRFRYPTMTAYPVEWIWLPENKLIAFGSSNGQTLPYMWYGLDPVTGNITTTFPIDFYPLRDLLFAGSDPIVRHGVVNDVAPYQIDNGINQKRGLFFTATAIGKDKFSMRLLQNKNAKTPGFVPSYWSVANPAAGVMLWGSIFGGGVISLSTGETLMNITAGITAPIAPSSDRDQSPLTARFVGTWYNRNASETCYGFLSLENLSGWKPSWCDGSMRNMYCGLNTYSEDHGGFFFGYGKDFQDTNLKLYFLPMQWGVPTEPYLVPGNITVPWMEYSAVPQVYRTQATSIKL